MDGIVCDRCGEGLLLDSDVRYVLNLEIQAAYDPMEITPADLEKDFDAEYRKILKELDQLPAAEAERQVHFRKQYDLCPKCRREFLSDPLFRTE